MVEPSHDITASLVSQFKEAATWLGGQAAAVRENQTWGCVLSHRKGVKIKLNVRSDAGRSAASL